MVKPNRKMDRWVLEFPVPRGCERSIVDEMVRYDSATLIETTTDERCPEGNVRTVTIDLPVWSGPTLGRWASFAVRARVKSGPKGWEGAL